MIDGLRPSTFCEPHLRDVTRRRGGFEGPDGSVHKTFKRGAREAWVLSVMPRARGKRTKMLAARVSPAALAIAAKRGDAWLSKLIEATVEREPDVG